MLFIAAFSILAIFTFYNNIILNVTQITIQLVMVSFAILGSSVLVVLTILLQVRNCYRPTLSGVRRVIEGEAMDAISETQRVLGESMEVALNKRSEYEEVLQKYLEKRKSPEIPLVVSSENLAQQEITQETPSPESIFDPVQKESSLKVQGMTTHHVSLLEDLGISTIDELCIQDPEHLYRDILDWNILNKNNYEHIPTMGMIKRWIRIANQRYI